MMFDPGKLQKFKMAAINVIFLKRKLCNFFKMEYIGLYTSKTYVIEATET